MDFKSQENTNSSRRQTRIVLSNEPNCEKRVKNPYGSTNPSKIDGNNKVLSDVRDLLSKLTLQTYDNILKKLEALEIDRYERLEGLISIFFSKVK